MVREKELQGGGLVPVTAGCDHIPRKLLLWNHVGERSGNTGVSKARQVSSGRRPHVD